MEKICYSCKLEKCKQCENRFKCHCKCNDNSFADISVKLLAVASGILMIVVGLALSISSTGLLAVSFGGALLGAGINSCSQGVFKALRYERLEIFEFLADVLFAAIAGVLNGGIISTGEVAVAGTNKTIKVVGVRAITGAVAGLISKTTDEVKKFVLILNESKLKAFYDSHRNNNLVYDLVMSGFSGFISGTSTHLSHSFSKNLSSRLGKSISNIIFSAFSSALAHSIYQQISIALGKQKAFNKKRLFTTIFSTTLNRTFKEALKLLALQVSISKKSRVPNECAADDVSCKQGMFRSMHMLKEEEEEEGVNEEEDEAAVDLLMSLI